MCDGNIQSIQVQSASDRAVHFVPSRLASLITHYRIQKSYAFIYKVVPLLEVLTVLINSFFICVLGKLIWGTTWQNLS